MFLSLAVYWTCVLFLIFYPCAMLHKLLGFIINLEYVHVTKTPHPRCILVSISKSWLNFPIVTDRRILILYNYLGWYNFRHVFCLDKLYFKSDFANFYIKITYYFYHFTSILTMLSANFWFVSPAISIALFPHFKHFNTSSKAVMNNLGDRTLPCLMPLWTNISFISWQWRRN